MQGAIKIFSGSAHPALAESICRYLNVAPGQMKLTSFSDGETYCQVLENVRRVATELGVPGGIHASPGRVTAMLEKGYQFVAVGFDISFMASAATAALQAARRKTATA